MELFAVVTMVGGFAREDAPSPSLVGVYDNPDLGERVRRVHGMAQLFPVVLNTVSPGQRQAAQKLGLGLKDAALPPSGEPLTVSVVLGSMGGFAREDAPDPVVYGAFSDAAAAAQTKILTLGGATVESAVLNAIPPGLVRTAHALGVAFDAPAPRRGPSP